MMKKTYPRASNTWFEKNNKSLKSNRVVFRLDSGIRQEFEKEWLGPMLQQVQAIKSLALEVKNQYNYQKCRNETIKL